MVALLLAWAVQASPQAAPLLTCAATGAATGREFVLERPDPSKPWRLRYRDREHPAWIVLALPGAAPAIERDTARLQYHNANGGRQVTIAVAPGTARLDIYVDYGLDVNIDADLDPEVDRMNTDGPLTAVECTVTPQPGAP